MVCCPLPVGTSSMRLPIYAYEDAVDQDNSIVMDNLNNRYVTRWVTTQERFPNKSMLMTGTNNNLRFRNTKLYLIIRRIQDKKKLYSDKKGVSCVKVRVKILIKP